MLGGWGLGRRGREGRVGRKLYEEGLEEGEWILGGG